MASEDVMMLSWLDAALRVAVITLTSSLALAEHALPGELPTSARPPADREVVLVAGATGRTGRLIIEQLRAEERFEVRALARDPVAAGRKLGAGYHWLQGDVTRPETLTAPMRGARFVICAIGATRRSGPNGPEFVDYGGVRNLTDAAREAGIRQVVLISSMGVGGSGGLIRWILNVVGGDVLQWKAKGEAYLRASGVPYTIIRPGGLRNDPGGREGLRLLQGDQEFGDISRADTAAVAVATLANADAVGKTFEVLADESAPLNGWRSGFAGLKADPP